MGLSFLGRGNEPDLPGANRSAGWRGLSSRAVGAVTVAAAILVVSLSLLSVKDTASASRPGAESLGSVTNSPQLPTGFNQTFESRFVEANGIRQHVVVGGEGPPVLLVHGWPENWYAWRFLMLDLVKDHTVIAVDQRGIGLSEKTAGGYDSGTLADDLAALMTELGHDRFAVVGHDTGYIIGYALAADHRDRVARLAVAEIPGPPGVGEPADQPPLFVPEPLNDKLWHIPFNRVNDELIVDMVASNAEAYYRYEYDIQGGGWTLPKYARDYYVRLYARSKNTLRASFGLYRAWDAHVAQNAKRQNDPLTIPVLGIGGENSWGAAAGSNIRGAASDVETVVIPDTGHWVAEEAPVEVLQALRRFLEPYRTGAR